MKKLLLFTVLISIYAGTFAQEKTDSIQYKYCDVVCYKKVGGPKYCIAVDSGQLSTGGMIPNQYKDLNGNTYIFNSPMDGVNFMIRNKWDIFQVYSENINPSSIPHYLLRKRIN
jgi:hypothetical protein